MPVQPLQMPRREQEEDFWSKLARITLPAIGGAVGTAIGGPLGGAIGSGLGLGATTQLPQPGAPTGLPAQPVGQPAPVAAPPPAQTTNPSLPSSAGTLSDVFGLVPAGTLDFAGGGPPALPEQRADPLAFLKGLGRVA